jgi:2',3'-cyclic-nucleotide 2'-phosphodiesterase (5'-nucleotidase family)
MPVVCANVDSSQSTINQTVKPYHVFPEHKLALIAVTTDTIPSISNPSSDTTFSDPIATTQYWVDYINENEADVDRIVVMTHIGYALDRELAKQTTGVYIIVGAHSHTLLLGEPKKLENGTWDNTGDVEHDAKGSYPTIIENKDGEEVFVVTSYRYGEYLGHISLEFDPSGKILSYVGAPIHLQSNNSMPNNETVYNATVSTAQDPELVKEIKEWRGPFEEYASVVIGETETVLDQSTCQDGECTFGDFSCDAMLDALSSSTNSSSPVVSCILNSGGIRASIDVGDITRGQVLTAFPFGNTITQLTFSGADLWKIWEGIVSGTSQFNGNPLESFAQTSNGTKVTYNPSLAVGSQLISLEIASEAVDLEKEYAIVTLDFLAGGGDNILPAASDFVSLDTADEVVTAYINKTSPINFELEGRIATTNDTAQ